MICINLRKNIALNKVAPNNIIKASSPVITTA